MARTVKAVKFHGSTEERTQLAKEVMERAQREDREWHVCVTTYEVCNIDKDALNMFAWSYLIMKPIVSRMKHPPFPRRFGPLRSAIACS